MKLAEAKQQFIQSWGSLATQWGINKTMAQVHALLMATPGPLNQDEIMDQLSISRGNVNMNIRELINWGLVERVILPGERKEFFTAEKDVWKVARQVIKERKKRELDPLIKTLEQLQDIEGDKRDKEIKQFIDTVAGIQKFAQQADRTLDIMIKADENWFWGNMLKLFK
ncbi:MAG: winged helix-turn-helix transcriptional regulator [Chitinophagaceae bacterium]|nr:winged helix-turn-helix transcriptional regulator [Chitinophagaceae bacterium]